MTQPSRAVAASLLLLAILAIASLTLMPAPRGPALPTYCIFCGSLGGVDFTLNILLFVPAGLALLWLTGSWTTTTIIGAAMTLVIETLQWRFIPGRDASLGDLLANTLGTMLGAWLAVEFFRWVNASAAVARRLAGVFAVMTATVVSGSALLLLPVGARSPQFVQWKPVRLHTDWFPAAIVGVELNGKPIHAYEKLPVQSMIDTADGSLSVRVILQRPIAPSRRQAIIVNTANEWEEGFFVAQRVDDVVFRTSVAASRLRLRPILIGSKRAFALSRSGDGPTDTVFNVIAHSSTRSMVLSTSSAGNLSSVTFPRTVGLGWTLLLPWDVAVTTAWWPASALWIGLLLFPVTFFVFRATLGVRSDPDRRLAWWPAALALGILTVFPLMMGLSPPGLGEWTGAIAGVSVAGVLERWTAAHAPAILRADPQPEMVTP